MADEVKFDEREFRRRLEAFQAKAKSLGELSGEISQMLLLAVEDEFDSQGGGEWEPFAASTLKRHPRRAGGKLLQDTTEMIGSIKPESDSESASVVTTNPYAGYHVEGTKYMPARDFTDIDYDELGMQIGDLLLKEITG